jgi:hypothetical protein
MRVRPARRVLTVLAGAICLFAGFSGIASAGPSSTVKGSPQPELAPFVIAGTGSAGAQVALGPNKTFVVVYQVNAHYEVCVLARGARKCKSKVELNSENGSSDVNDPQVFVVGSDVDVVMGECCYADYLLFQSTNGGKSFGAGENIGTNDDLQGIGSAVVDGTDAIVDSAPLYDPAAAEQTSASVVPNGSGNNELENSGIGTYKGGVLVAASTFANVPSTRVYYAPEGSDPGSLSSYRAVGTFSNARFQFLEGNALITQKVNGKTPFEIRMFNGTSFGAEHEVPYSDDGGPQWFGAAVSSSGRVFFFSSRNQDSYDLYIESTTNGSHWTTRRNYGNAVTSDSFNGALDSIGSGIVVGAGNPVRAYPVMVSQPVSFHLSRSSVVEGTRVTATGVGSHPKAGRTVKLERLIAGLWHNIASTSESASGKFTFHITEHTAGSYTFRARASDETGYVQYGYSAAKVLKVSKP